MFTLLMAASVTFDTSDLLPGLERMSKTIGANRRRVQVPTSVTSEEDYLNLKDDDNSLVTYMVRKMVDEIQQ